MVRRSNPHRRPRSRREIVIDPSALVGDDAFAGCETDLERKFLWQLRVAGLPEPTPQYRLKEYRRSPYDFGWESCRLVVELQGGVWMRKSGHNTGSGITRDCRKLNRTTMAGWKQFNFTTNMVDSGEALDIMIKFFEKENKNNGNNGSK